MALYEVKMKMTVMVYCEEGTIHQAEEIAIENAAEEFANGTGDIRVKQVVEVDDIPEEWVDCIPWGDPVDEKTCEQIITGASKNLSALRCSHCGCSPVVYRCRKCGNDYCGDCAECDIPKCCFEE